MLSSFIQIIVSGLLSGSIYALIAVGLALLVGVVSLVNYGQGELLMVGMYVVYWIYALLGVSPYLGMPLTILIMVLLGFIMFKVIYERVLQAEHEIQILITLGVSTLLQNLALMIFKADFRNIRIPLSNHVFEIGDIIISTPRFIACVIAICASVGLYLFLTRTYIGTAMRAIAQDNKAAQLMGIKLKKTYRLAFLISIGTVGLAAVLITPMYPTYPMAGQAFILPAFVVLVVGGLTNITGAIVGGLLVGVVENLTAYFVGTSYQQAGYFALLILVLIFRPNGLISTSSDRAFKLKKVGSKAAQGGKA